MKIIKVKWSILKNEYIVLGKEVFDDMSIHVGDIIMLTHANYHPTDNTINVNEFFSKIKGEHTEIHS